MSNEDEDQTEYVEVLLPEGHQAEAQDVAADSQEMVELN